MLLDPGNRTTAVEEQHPGYPLAPPVEIGDDLPAIDQLAAFMSRQPEPTGGHELALLGRMPPVG